MAKTSNGARGGVAFLITFLVFLVLFGGMMAWGINDFWRQTYDESETDPTTDITTAPEQTESRTHRVLLITEDGGEAQGFVVLSAEATMSRIQVVPVPRETVVTEGVTQCRLFELYKTVDVATVKAQVAALLGWEIDHYAVMTYDSLQRYITHLNGGVIYMLTEDVSYETASGTTVNMKSGARTLSASQTVDLLNYTGWHGGRRVRATVQGEIAAAMINQYFLAGKFDERDTAFHTLMNYVRSDILTSHFVAARGDLLLLAQRNEFNICSLREPAGEFVGTGDAMRFEMADKPFG